MLSNLEGLFQGQGNQGLLDIADVVHFLLDYIDVKSYFVSGFCIFKFQMGIGTFQLPLDVQHVFSNVK